MLATRKNAEIIREAILYAEKNGRFHKKNIYLFGCTLYARDIRDMLRNINIEISGIIDNNPDKAGKKCLGVNVCLPQEMESKDAITIICSKYSYEMREQLKALGAEDILDIPVSEGSCDYGDSEGSLTENYRQVQDGAELYEKIREKYPDAQSVFLCPYPGTGDIYMACVYFRAYCRKRGIDRYVFLVNGENCRRVAELFEIDNIAVVTEEERDHLLKAWEFLGNCKMPLKPLLYWGWRTKRYLYADRHPQITFNEMFLYDVFGFDKPAQKEIPPKDKAYAYAKKLFAEKSLTPGKTAILAPYAGSFVSEMGMDEWERLAWKLKETGYDVCTNCNGAAEKPIQGTTSVFFPYKEAVSVVEYAGGFIALRSGLCDIVSTADCKMAVIYEHGFNAARYDFFSLVKMGLTKNASEFVYETETIADRVLGEFLK